MMLTLKRSMHSIKPHASNCGAACSALSQLMLLTASHNMHGASPANQLSEQCTMPTIKPVYGFHVRFSDLATCVMQLGPVRQQ